MRKIKYKTLRIQNFLSVGNDEIVINFKNGLNLISGKNIDNPERNNGSGKSSVIEAFFYGLFGKTIREIKKEFIVNNVTKGKGKVELEFDVETEQGIQTYTVKRQVKPSSVTLLRGEEDITKDSIANTDKFICDLIGSNPVICRSCDILSLSDNVPFMAKKPEEKRKFINDIFSLEVFGKMSKDLKELIRENKTEVEITNTKIQEIENTIQTLSDQQKEYDKKIKEREEVLERKKAELNDKIKDCETKISNIVIEDDTEIKAESSKLNDGLSKIEIKLTKINSDISSKDTLKSVEEKQIDKISSVGGAKCDKCLQDIPHTHIDRINSIKIEHEQNIIKLSDEIKELRTSKSDLTSKKEKIEDRLEVLQKKLNSRTLNIQTVKNLEKLIEEYKDSISSLKEDDIVIPSLTENIKNIEERKNKEEEILKNLIQYSEDLEICKFVLSEEGVKSFIIKKLLSILNNSIQQYIAELGMSIRCKFDEYFDEQMHNDKGKDISYWNLSGGERRTIDLACAWAFKDIKRKISEVSSNVEFFDEIFDSAFDERGLDLLIDVLKKRLDDNTSIYAISHRKETLKHIDGEIIMLEKENGVTKRIDIPS